MTAITSQDTARRPVTSKRRLAHAALGFMAGVALTTAAAFGVAAGTDDDPAPSVPAARSVVVVQPAAQPGCAVVHGPC